MLTPFEQVHKLFNEEHPDGCFENELAWHLANGQICNFTTEVGILAIYSRSDRSVSESYNVLPIEECDTWKCSYAAGSMDAICRYIESLEPRMMWIVFERTKNNNKPTKILTERFLQYGKNS